MDVCIYNAILKLKKNVFFDFKHSKGDVTENVLGDWEHLRHRSQTGICARFGPELCLVWPLHFCFVLFLIKLVPNS